MDSKAPVTVPEGLGSQSPRMEKCHVQSRMATIPRAECHYSYNEAYLQTQVHPLPELSQVYTAVLYTHLYPFSYLRFFYNSVILYLPLLTDLKSYTQRKTCQQKQWGGVPVCFHQLSCVTVIYYLSKQNFTFELLYGVLHLKQRKSLRNHSFC